MFLLIRDDVTITLINFDTRGFLSKLVTHTRSWDTDIRCQETTLDK